jgi:hypothetical protein
MSPENLDLEKGRLQVRSSRKREWDSNFVFVLLLNNLLILQNARIAKNATIANVRHVRGTRTLVVDCVRKHHGVRRDLG